ncbi:polysaccharide biosynthesis tyrosine autokinase [Curtobacterium flaccumfaciens]|uniref:polysaccharide biosynthesis tyrosine autokinase n=1 Tax=Curtobacterium TaxID=2034 RepID=UPI000F482379|nr:MULTISPECIES: polysaccharide biosynthesis tyrosine autokinase [Curtobacterium]ROR36433.1 capsular exopolysaccharide synthesis family protein [Curtobacterium sp. JUb34]UXN20895.1 polysaccharide biosynthesis tyrosine autokinase [Curtobacterium flaccumfaciens pv. flaccumfaciens]
MDIERIAHLLRRGWIAMMVGALLGAGSGAALAYVTVPEYQASTQVYVSVTGATNSSELAQGGTAAEQKVQSFANVAKSARVLEPVIRQLGLHESAIELARRVSAQTPIDSVIVTISVVDPDPDQAARIANSVGSSLSKVITTELEQPTADGVSPFRIETIQPAIAPTHPTSPRVAVNLAGGLALGLTLGLGIAVLRAALDTRLDSRAAVESVIGAPAIGEIAFDKSVRDQPLVVLHDSMSPRAEAFRRLRTNLQFLDVGGSRRSFVVTSSVPSEGKSTTAANMAIALAESGMKIALVDCDLRRPRIAEIMGLEAAAGLTDVLIGRMELEDALQPWGKGELQVVPSGQVPPNPTELLGSAAMEAVLRELESLVDVVIIDAPPLLPVTDAAILAGISSGAIVVAAMRRTTRKQLEGASAALRDAGTKALGSIMTMVRVSRSDAYSYNYRYQGTRRPHVDPVEPLESASRPSGSI